MWTLPILHPYNMRRYLSLTMILICLTLGVWQTGQAIWIYLKAEIAQFLLEQAWVKTLGGETEARPWPWADTWPIARMVVPKHGIHLIVLSHANGRTLAFGPGHESISALPGQEGTTILSGHRDTHFNFLKKIMKGEQIIIQHPHGPPRVYTIQSINIVDARHTRLHLSDRQAHLILVTCYPFETIRPGGSLRLVVTAVAHPFS